jgi:hypothetical protein
MDLADTPVIATMNRPEPLRQVLESLGSQIFAPAAIVVDASTDQFPDFRSELVLIALAPEMQARFAHPKFPADLHNRLTTINR